MIRFLDKVTTKNPIFFHFSILDYGNNKIYWNYNLELKNNILYLDKMWQHNLGLIKKVGEFKKISDVFIYKEFKWIKNEIES